MATRKKKSLEQIKDIMANGAQDVIEFFLGDEVVRKSYIKVLHESGMSQAEICKAAHCSQQTLKDVLSGNDQSVQDGMVETLRGVELNRLHMIGAKILQVMADPGKIEGMKGGDLAYAYKTFLEARRLLENKSTANISVMIQAFVKKIEGEGDKIDNLMKGIARKDPRIVEEESVAQLRHSG
jgi:hypothetical protein